jgi:hypothetical protein
MRRTTLYLPEKTHRMMKRLSARCERSMGRIVEQAVDYLFQEELRDIEDAEKALTQYKRNPASAVSFDDYLKRRAH